MYLVKMALHQLFTSATFKTYFLHILSIAGHKVVDGECLVLELLKG